MAKFRIEMFESGAPSATITVPTWLVTGASKLFPKIAGQALQEHIDLDELIAMAKASEANGELIELADHKSDERIVISIVGPETKAA